MTILLPLSQQLFLPVLGRQVLLGVGECLWCEFGIKNSMPEFQIIQSMPYLTVNNQTFEFH